MGVVVSPSGAGCDHVDIIDDSTGAKLGTITRQQYGEIVGIPPTGWDPAWATNRATIESRAITALQTNATYLAIGSPTNAQNLAQIRALTRECNGVIRLLLGLLDSTTNT